MEYCGIDRVRSVRKKGQTVTVKPTGGTQDMGIHTDHTSPSAVPTNWTGTDPASAGHRPEPVKHIPNPANTTAP